MFDITLSGFRIVANKSVALLKGVGVSFEMSISISVTLRIFPCAATYVVNIILSIVLMRYELSILIREG